MQWKLLLPVLLNVLFTMSNLWAENPPLVPQEIYDHSEAIRNTKLQKKTDFAQQLSAVDQRLDNPKRVIEDSTPVLHNNVLEVERRSAQNEAKLAAELDKAHATIHSHANDFSAETERRRIEIRDVNTKKLEELLVRVRKSRDDASAKAQNDADSLFLLLFPTKSLYKHKNTENAENIEKESKKAPEQQSIKDESNNSPIDFTQGLPTFSLELPPLNTFSGTINTESGNVQSQASPTVREDLRGLLKTETVAYMTPSVAT